MNCTPFVRQYGILNNKWGDSLWQRIPKKLASLGFGRRATPAQKTQVVQKLRQKHKLELLLSIAHLPRATFYYHLKQMSSPDKCEPEKAEITAIYHENKETVWTML